MSRAGELALTAGGFLFALGIVIAVDPAVSTLLPVTDAVSALGNDYLLAAGIGVFAGVVGLGVMGLRARNGFDQATPPSAEDVPTGVPLGRDVDRVVRGDVMPHEHVVGDLRERVRERLHRAAVGTVLRTERCSRETARERVATGEWADDEVAAAFLAERDREPLLDRLLDAMPGRSRFGRRTERTVRALLARDGMEGERER